MKTLPALASALAFGSAMIAAPALAEPISSDTNVSIVHTADLDLSSEAGRRALQQRLSVAAHEVCDDASAADIRAQNAEKACRSEVLAAARTRVAALESDPAADREIAIAATR